MQWTLSSLLLIELGIILAVASATSSLRASLDSPVTPHRSLLQASQVLRPHHDSTVVERSHRCSFDHSGFHEVLQKFVKSPETVDGIRSSLFDYEAILNSQPDLLKLNDYVESFSTFDPSCFGAKHAKLAFWANAYNSMIIHFILRSAQHNGGRLPSSIKDLKGSKPAVWDRTAGTVAGKAMTLEQILTEASKLGDPRIHAAVNCASLSCPDLRGSAYIADTMDDDLDDQVKNWLQNPSKGAKVDGDRVRLSPIFRWHASDFPSVSSFVSGILGLDGMQIAGYLDYNWNLNAVHRSAEATTEDANEDEDEGSTNLAQQSSSQKGASASVGLPVMITMWRSL